MSKPKEIAALNSRLRKVEKGENTNVFPIMETDEIDTDLESETGFIDMEENTPVSQSMAIYTPVLPVGGAGTSSDSDPEAAESHHDRSKRPAHPPITPDPDTRAALSTRGWSSEHQQSSVTDPHRLRQEGHRNIFKPDPESGEDPATGHQESFTQYPEVEDSWSPHTVPVPLEIRRLGPPPEVTGPRQAARRAIDDLWSQLTEQRRTRRNK